MTTLNDSHRRGFDWRALAPSLLWHIVPPLALLAVVLAFHPFRDVFSFDPDEGNNLMKARLLADGYGLYSQIWSDQPPLLTYVLAGWLNATGWTVEHGRLFVVLCSCVLFWALYQCVRITGGHAAASASCLLLVLSSEYLRLSGSVMLGVPSLMLAMLSMLALLHYRRVGGLVLPAAAGACLALSVLVKMWTAMLIPVAAVALVLAIRKRRAEGEARRPALPVALCAGGFAVTAGIMLLLTVPSEGYAQLIRPHVAVRGTAGLEVFARSFWAHFAEDIGIVLLGCAGAAWALFRRRWTALIPAVWAILAVIVFANHEPLWYHHYLMVSIPLCWAAGLAVGALASREAPAACWPWHGAPTVGAWGLCAVALVAGVLVAWQAPAAIHRDFGAWSGWPSPSERNDRAVVATMTELEKESHFIVTDRQILAFRAGLRVPPPLAVTSLKRQWAGDLTDRQVIEVIEGYRPSLVYLTGRRIPLTRDLVDYLRPRFHIVHGSPADGFLLADDRALRLSRGGRVD